MSDAKEIIRRIERNQKEDWQAEYIRLLPPVPAPTRTPGCTFEWNEERMLCVAEPSYFHTAMGKTAPDRGPLEAIP